MCGDQILLTARVCDGAVAEVAFEAFGCSASLAVASILTERFVGHVLGRPGRSGRGPYRRLVRWTGSDQRHVATLGADVAHRLARNYRDGVIDDSPVSAG